ncbi:PAS domain S-box-containing protein [Desulfobaculum xiamenense]|uniref:Sensory/regulatory protein RpfC n=1 Tax=Desulfobaculum xiamenense TaxID=995050 RepID=A0A846QIA8_9BACT|nr:PAS domain S-box protein [Desulfobaculum xiamenense]NJB67921.1 PAS domain S-box-containing protein [Desulfobaculum xiamenense]
MHEHLPRKEPTARTLPMNDDVVRAGCDIGTPRYASVPFDDLLSRSSVIIYTASPIPGFPLLSLSPNFSRVLGHPSDIARHTPNFWLSHVHPDDRRRIDFAQPVPPKGRVHEYRFRHADGSWRWLRDECVPDADAPDGQPRIAGIWIDITTQREATRKARVRSNLFKAIFDGSPSAIMIVDAANRIVDANGKACELFGYHRSELFGLTPDALTHPEDMETTRMVIAATDGGEPTRHVEKRYLRKDGTSFWADVRVNAIYDEYGCRELSVVTINDISQRIGHERALRRAEAEKRLILSTITETVVHQTPDFRIIWANAAAGRAAGMPSDMMVGRLCHEVFMHDDSPCPDCPMPRAASAGSCIRSEVCHADGSLWEVHSYPIPAADGSMGSLIKVSREITEARRMEDDLRRARDLAENANKMKTEFLANMSHELRSPLNGVLGMLDVLLDTQLDAEQKDCVETALQAGEGLLAIINDILDFSKLQADMITLSHNEFDLRRTMRMVANTFLQQSRRKGLSLSYELDESVPQHLVGDEGRIRQILFNLIGNAVKFTRKGHVRVNVHFLRKSTAPDTARLLFSVRDTGIGIPEDQIETIFDPFIQLNWGKSRKYEGTGLGLGIVKRLVSRMGGIITVESRVGVGTNVEFWINVGLPQANG